MIYLDTSVLAAYYSPEPLSPAAERLVRSRTRPSISDLTEVELLSVLSRKVRLGELKPAEAARVAAQFLAHVEGNLYARLPVERKHYTLARDWIARFTTTLRTLDALHLAVAALEDLPLATTDKTLMRSAESLGVRIVPLR